MATSLDIPMLDLTGEDDDSLFFGRTGTYGERPSSGDSHDSIAPLEAHDETAHPNQDAAQPQTNLDYDVDSLLLKKPSTARTYELGEGFKYGPATRISAANFSRMPPKPLRAIPFPEASAPRSFMREQPSAQEPRTLSHRHESDFGITSANSELHSVQTVGLREGPRSGFWDCERVHDRAQAPDDHQDDAPTSAQKPTSSSISMSYVVDSFVQQTTTAEEPEPPVRALFSPRGNESQIDRAPDEVENNDVFVRPTIPPEHIKQGKPHHVPLPGGAADMEYTDRTETEERPRARPSRSHRLAVPFPEEGDLLRRSQNIPAPHNAAGVPEALCRPMKESTLGNSSTTRKHGTRAPSRASNVSKRRTPLQKRYRVSGASDVASATQSVSSYALTPDGRRRPSTVNFKFAESIAKEINGFIHEKNSELEEKLRDHALYIKRLKKERAAAETAISRYESQKAELDRQNQESHDSMAEHIRLLEAEVDATTKRVRKIEERYTACKDHLNSALEEQQQLYCRSKKQCEEAIQKMQEMEKSQSALVELTAQRTDEIREKMSEQVRQVVEQSKAETQALQEQIISLQRQVEEKTSELANEQTTVRVLSEKLKDAQALSAGFDGLMSQNKDVLEKLEEQIRSRFEHDQMLESQAKERFDAVKEHLNDLSELTSSHPQDLEDIRKAYQESTDNLISKLDVISNSQNTSCEFIENLPSEVEAHAQRILDKLEAREEINLRLQEKSEENGMLSTLFKQAEQRSAELEAELDAMKRDADEQDTHIRALEDKLFLAEQAENKSADAARQLAALESKADRLEHELKSANAVARGLEDKLHMKEETFTSEIRRLTGIVDQHNQMMQQREAIARAESEKAVEVTRREARIELERAGAEAKKALQQTEQARDHLARELEMLREVFLDKERNSSAEAVRIKELREELNNSTSRQAAMAAEIDEYNLKLSQSQQKESERVIVLEGRLIESNELASQLRDAATQQSMKTQTFTEALNTWARQKRMPDEALGELNKLASENMTTKEIEASLHQVLDGIVMALRYTMEPDTSDSLVLAKPDDESSRFFPKSSSQLSRRGSLGVDELSQPSIATIDSQSTLGGSSSFEFNNLQESQHLAPPLDRRVVVRSPANEQAEPNPPSIAEEKESRRTAAQPKPIIKQASQTESQDGGDRAFQPNGELPGPTSLSDPILQAKRPQKSGKTPKTRSRANQTTSESSGRGRSKRKHAGEAAAADGSPARDSKTRNTAGQIKSSLSQTESPAGDDGLGNGLRSGQGRAQPMPGTGNLAHSAARNTRSRSAQIPSLRGPGPSEKMPALRSGRPRTYSSQRIDEDTMLSSLDSQSTALDSQPQSLFRSQGLQSSFMYSPSDSLLGR